MGLKDKYFLLKKKKKEVLTLQTKKLKGDLTSPKYYIY